MLYHVELFKPYTAYSTFGIGRMGMFLPRPEEKFYARANVLFDRQRATAWRMDAVILMP